MFPIFLFYDMKKKWVINNNKSNLFWKFLIIIILQTHFLIFMIIKRWYLMKTFAIFLRYHHFSWPYNFPIEITIIIFFLISWIFLKQYKLRNQIWKYRIFWWKKCIFDQIVYIEYFPSKIKFPFYTHTIYPSNLI